MPSFDIVSKLKKDEVLNAVEPKYSETLEKMQEYFTDDYVLTIIKPQV